MINIFNMEYDISQPWCKKIYDKYINESDKVCVLAYSYRDTEIANTKEWDYYYGRGGIYYNGIVSSYQKFGIKEENISIANYILHSKMETKKMIEESTILYLPGGIPTGFYEKIAYLDLLETIRSYKGVIIGCSAGAMIQLDEYHITPDKDYSVFSIERGMGLATGFGVEPHYVNSEIQNESIRIYQEKNNYDVYGIGDKGMIVCEDNHVVTYGDVTNITLSK